MSVTKAELVRINGQLQETIRLLLRESRVLQRENQRLKETLSVSTERIEQMTRRYGKLTDYVKRLHAWARSKESQR